MAVYQVANLVHITLFKVLVEPGGVHPDAS